MLYISDLYCAVANEIDYVTVNQHSWDPWQRARERRVTSDFNSVLLSGGKLSGGGGGGERTAKRILKLKKDKYNSS